MRKSLIKTAGIVFLAAMASFSGLSAAPFEPMHFGVIKENIQPERLYDQMNLRGIVDYDLFRRGIEGYNELDPVKTDVLTLIDFTKSSGDERFYVLDLRNKKLLFKTFVSHGRNSGQDFATSFSNRYGSFKSSPGFYRTENTYKGRNGYSLVLNGLEEGINDNAKKRAIVVHGSDYVNSSIANSRGQVARSLGCPAVPRSISRKVIDAIKGGSLLYIHSDSPAYLAKSVIAGNNYIPYASLSYNVAQEWLTPDFPGINMV